MKKSIYLGLVGAMSAFMLTGCGDTGKDEVVTLEDMVIVESKSEEAPVEESKSEEASVEETKTEGISQDQALKAIVNYCCKANPDLTSVAEAGEYATYWDISSEDDQQFVVVFRSYTGAIVRYYIDKETGDTHVTEFVAGIMEEEEPTDEKFNVKDYMED